MTFADSALTHDRPASIRRNVVLPRRQRYHASPVDWRGGVLYFLLVDRRNLGAARPALPWRWDRWAESGAGRWQGGNLRGVTSKLPYLKKLGVSTLWLSPVFKQRGHEDSYHGYGVQDFLDIDPRFGTRRELVELVTAAHQAGLRIVLDIIFNHSGFNWRYPSGLP